MFELKMIQELALSTFWMALASRTMKKAYDIMDKNSAKHHYYFHKAVKYHERAMKYERAIKYFREKA